VLGRKSTGTPQEFQWHINLIKVRCSGRTVLGVRGVRFLL
jgi:hypothetical protein